MQTLTKTHVHIWTHTSMCRLLSLVDIHVRHHGIGCAFPSSPDERPARAHSTNRRRGHEADVGMECAFFEKTECCREDKYGKNAGIVAPSSSSTRHTSPATRVTVTAPTCVLSVAGVWADVKHVHHCFHSTTRSSHLVTMVCGSTPRTCGWRGDMTRRVNKHINNNNN